MPFTRGVCMSQFVWNCPVSKRLVPYSSKCLQNTSMCQFRTNPVPDLTGWNIKEMTARCLQHICLQSICINNFIFAEQLLNCPAYYLINSCLCRICFSSHFKTKHACVHQRDKRHLNLSASLQNKLSSCYMMTSWEGFAARKSRHGPLGEEKKKFLKVIDSAFAEGTKHCNFYSTFFHRCYTW